MTTSLDEPRRAVPPDSHKTDGAAQAGQCQHPPKCIMSSVAQASDAEGPEHKRERTEWRRNHQQKFVLPRKGSRLLGLDPGHPKTWDQTGATFSHRGTRRLWPAAPCSPVATWAQGPEHLLRRPGCSQGRDERCPGNRQGFYQVPAMVTVPKMQNKSAIN